MARKLKLCLLGLIVLASLVGAVRAYDRAAAVERAEAAAGYVPWPAGPDQDDDLVWRVVPARYFALAELAQPSMGVGVLVVGFALWMALLGYVTRSTPIPYIAVVASLVFSFLCTGGFGAASPKADMLVVDAGAKLLRTDDGTSEALCRVSRLAVDERDAAKGGPDYWVVAHFDDGRAQNLSVFGTRALAVYLMGQIQKLQANAECVRAPN